MSFWRLPSHSFHIFMNSIEAKVKVKINKIKLSYYLRFEAIY